MSDFIVSARKYRPATFDTVVGQQPIVSTLKNAISKGQLAHAYLFCGSRGVGKTTTARIFAKTINCQNPRPDGEACGECESCKAFEEGRSFNIHELDAASNNSVDDIRSLIDQVRIPPQIGKYCVYIIDEVHMLSTAAFNAFLKTLEEPPSYAIFILATTEKQKILPTIISRCQVFDFSRIGVDDIVAHLQGIAAKEGVDAEPDALNVIAVKSDGGMRDALSTFDQIVSFAGNKVTYKDAIDNLNVLDYDYFFRFVDMFLSGDVQSSMLLYDEILAKGFDGQNFVSGLLSHFRDLLVAKDPKTAALLQVGAGIRQRYLEQAAALDLRLLYSYMEIANTCDLQYKQSRNKRLLVELMLIRLCQAAEQKKNKQVVTEAGKPPLANVFADVVAPQQQAAVPAGSSPTAAANGVAAPMPAKAQAPAQTAATNGASAPASISSATHTAQTSAGTAKPAPARPLAGRAAAGSFSLKAMMAGPKSQSSPSAAAAKRTTPFDTEKLNAAWFALPKVIADKSMLHNFFSSPAVLENGKTVVITTDNVIISAELKEVIPKLEQALRNSLQNDMVEISLRIVEAQQQRRFTTNTEKARFLNSQNGEFENLVKELELAFE